MPVKDDPLDEFLVIERVTLFPGRSVASPLLHTLFATSVLGRTIKPITSKQPSFAGRGSSSRAKLGTDG